MSAKGKEKEVDVVDFEDSEDEEAAFFEAPKRTFNRPIPPPTVPLSVPLASSPPRRRSSPGSADSDSDPSPPSKGTRRRGAGAGGSGGGTNSSKHATILPDWTRETHVPRRGASGEGKDRRGTKRSSEERGVGGVRKNARNGTKRWGENDDDAIEVLSTDEDDSDDVGTKPKRRDRIELTPPPKVDVKKVHEAFRQFYGTTPEKPIDFASSSDAVSSPARDEGPPVTVNVRMVADPERLKTGSTAAVKAYTKLRCVTMGMDAPLSRLIDTLAHQLGKASSELVLVYKNNRIFALKQTPRDLGILREDNIQGYEKVYYEAMEAERREQRARELAAIHGRPTEATNPDVNSEGPGEGGGDESGAVFDNDDDQGGEEDQIRMRVKVRGEGGEFECTVRPETTVAAICKSFCRNIGVTENRAKKMVVDFDGEAFKAGATVEDMGVEEGDMLDVREK